MLCTMPTKQRIITLRLLPDLLHVLTWADLTMKVGKGTTRRNDVGRLMDNHLDNAVHNCAQHGPYDCSAVGLHPVSSQSFSQPPLSNRQCEHRRDFRQEPQCDETPSGSNCGQPCSDGCSAAGPHRVSSQSPFKFHGQVRRCDHMRKVRQEPQ